METLLATLLMLQINLYRLEAGLQYVPINEETCMVATKRLEESKEKFAHNGIASFIDTVSRGTWYENLGRVLENPENHFQNSQVVLNGWRGSESHNTNLLADMNNMCVKTDGVYFVFTAHGEQNADN